MRSPRSPGRAAAAVGRIRCSWELCLPGSLATPLPPAWRVPSWWPQTWGIGTEKPTTFLPRGVLPRCWASSTLGQEGGLCPCKPLVPTECSGSLGPASAARSWMGELPSPSSGKPRLPQASPVKGQMGLRARVLVPLLGHCPAPRRFRKGEGEADAPC